ncbi:MAG: hypothetical protein WCR56_01835 [Bacilli bacterium]
MKKPLIYTLVSLMSLGISGTAVYFSCGVASNASGNDVNNGNDENNDGSAVTPEIPEIPTTDNSFSRMVNKLLTIGEIQFPELDVTLDTASTDPIYLNFTNLSVDLANATTLDINFETGLEVKYGSSIDETLHLNFEDSGYAYVIYYDHYYSFSAPTTVSGFISMIQACGVSIPNVASGSDVDLSSVISSAQSAADNIASSETSNNYGGVSYTIALDPLTIGSTTISNIDVVLDLDGSDNLVAVNTAKDITVSNGMSLGLNATCNFLEESTYTKVDTKKYQDLTNATSSILSTVAKIVGEKKTNVGIAISLNDGTNDHVINGLMQADVSGVDNDLTKGKYALSLTHADKATDATVSDNINVTYSNETTYIQLDDLFKGKVQNTTLSNVFDSLSSATGNSSYKGVTDELTNVLGKCDLTTLLSGDYSVYKNFLSSFTYTENTGFDMTLNAKAFGLGDYQIEIKVNLDETNKKITSIEVNNLKYQSLTLNIALSPDDFTSIASVTPDDYKNYSAIAPIFSTISNVISSKQVACKYALTYTSGSDSYAAGGTIAADLSAVTSFDALSTTIDNGNYQLSFNTTVGNTTHALNMNYQNKSLYFGYDNGGTNAVFKNSLTDTSIGKMADVIKKETSTGDESLTSMDSILDSMIKSTSFKTAISQLKQGYVSGISGFLSIDKDNKDANKLIVSVDVPKILEGTSYASKIGAITLTVNTDDKSISSIAVTSAINGTNSISFTLSFLDYVKTSYTLTSDQIAAYTPINYASELLQSFYNLQGDYTKFGIGVNASLTKDDSTIVSTTGAAAIDITDTKSPVVYGNLALNTPSLSDSSKLAKQNIDFSYQNDTDLDGQFIAEYNDTMHIMMHSSTVSDIYSQVETAKADQQNLLYKYLNNLNSVSNSMPISDAITNKNYSTLLAEPYIQKIDIADTYISLTVDGRLLNSEDTTGSTDTIKVTYDNVNCHITGLSLDATYKGMNIKANITKKTYEEVTAPTMTAYTSETKDSFIDMDSFSTLVACGLDTTENNFFDLEGNVNVNAVALKYLNLSLISTYVTAKVYIGDQNVSVYLSFNNGNKALTDSGFYCTEFFIQDDSIYVCQTKNKGTTGTTDKITSEVYKTTATNISSNIVYYALDYVLDIGDLNFGKVALANVYKAMSTSSSSSSSSSSSVTVSDDFSKLITSAKLNKDKQIFGLDIDLGSILSLGSDITFNNTNITLGYVTYTNDKDYTPFYAVQLSTSINAYNALTASVSTRFTLKQLAHVTSDEAKASQMSRYYNFIDSYSAYSSKPSYAINSIGNFTTQTWMGITNNYTVDDNSAAAKTYFSTYDASSVFFYQA